MSVKKLVIAFIFSSILAVSVIGEYYSMHQPSVSKLVQPPPPIAINRLWGFDWSSNLNINITSTREVKSERSRIVVSEIAYALFPDTPNCRIHGWLYYRRDLSGKAPGILLVHGIGGSHEMYEKEVPLAYTLAKRGYVVLSIDAAGHGKSCIVGSRDWREAAGKIENITENLFYQVYVSAIRGVEVLKNFSLVDSTRIGVIGVSMGGMTAIVVGSMHPDVKISIPIVASGCLACMFLEGSLANLIGNPNLKLSQYVKAKLSLIDPLVYAGGFSQTGKKYLFLFSTHDEYFAIEGLAATVTALEGRGASVVVFLAPNNDHYQVYPGWTDTIINFLDRFLLRNITRWGLSNLRLEYALFLAGYPNTLKTALRLAIPGTQYFWAPSYTLVLLPIDIIGFTIENGVAHTSLLSSIGYNEGAILAAISATILLYVLVSSRREIVYRVAAVAVYALSIMVYILPYASWPGRFTVTYPELYEKYAVLLSNTLHINILLWHTLLIVWGHQHC